MTSRLAFLLPLAACTGSNVPLDSGTGPHDACGAGLWGQAFASVEELECGLGESGPVYCHWTLSFGEGTYDWSYSDVGESGTVTCTDSELVGASGAGTPRQGTFHRTTARVTWEGASYEQTE